MAWKKLTTDDLKKILSQDEIDTLNSTSTELTATVQDAIDLVAQMFRGSFAAKGYEIDVREPYMPSSYELPALQYARYVAWTRFPNSPAIALDEARKAEIKNAQELLKNPYIGTDKPEWEHSSDNPDVTGSQKTGSIVVPWLVFDDGIRKWGDRVK